jgi:selenocysteine lyase/cysteine desulfurase
VRPHAQHDGERVPRPGLSTRVLSVRERIHGITDLAGLDQRAPAAAFTQEGYTPRQVAERLGGEGIFVRD